MRLDEARANRVLLNVLPFFGIALAGSQIPIEVVRSARWADQCESARRDSSRANAFPHLHPFGHRSCIDCRSRKKMHVIRHQNVDADPPAIVLGRTLPDFAQNFFALSATQEFCVSEMCSRKENNRIVAKRGHMCQMAKWNRSCWRRPALGPRRALPFGARARRLQCRSSRSPRTLRRADFHAFTLESCSQFTREFDRTRCIAVNTNCFAAHIDILAFD